MEYNNLHDLNVAGESDVSTFSPSARRRGQQARVFTTSIIDAIIERATDGADGRMIADELGLNVASLRVKCSQLGISLRRCRAARSNTCSSKGTATVSAVKLVSAHDGAVRQKARSMRTRAPTAAAGADVPVILKIPRLTLLQLMTYAATKGIAVEALASQLLTIIAQEQLCAAILDE
jgi:hypothetical protein